ncbi:MAG: polysaccharide biosynthesis C-terminal domain-containing protein [Mariprofundaceae bacterium]
MAISAVASIVLTPLLLSVYGKDGLGSYWVVLSIVSVMGMLEFGLLTSSSRFFAVAIGGGKGRLWSSVESLLKRYVFAILTLLALVASFVYFWLIGDVVGIEDSWREDASNLFLCLTAVLFLSVFTIPFAAKLQAFEQIQTLYFAQFLNALFRLIASLAVVLTQHSLWWLGLAALLATVISSCYQIYHARQLNDFPDNGEGDVLSWNEMMMTMLPLTVMMLGDILRFTVDSMIVGAFLGTALVAVYGVGFLPAELLKQAMAPFSRFFMVWASADVGREEGGHQRLFKFAQHAGIPIAIMCGATAASAPVLLRLWMGDDFVMSAAPVLSVLLLGFLFALPQTGVTGHLIGVGQQWPLAWLTLLEGVSNLLLTLALVVPLGVLGVAIGTCLPMIVSKGFIQPWLLARHCGLSYWHTWDHLLRLPLIWGLGIYAVLAWPAWNVSSIWELFAYLALAALMAGVPVMRRVLVVWRLRHGS